MLQLDIVDPSQVSEARRQAASLAQRMGLSEPAQGRLALVVTELGTNLLKHAGRGRLLLAPAPGGVDVLSLDRARGMADVRACMADGYSTAGTLGHGLGAVHRQAQVLEAVSWPGQGTAVLARVADAAPTAAASPPEDTGVICLPKAGEEVCGDAWSMYRDADGCTTVFMVDGLGHGPSAASAAQAAVRQFERSHAAEVTDIVEQVHLALKPTRGGAVAVARLCPRGGTATFAGLGNIAAALVSHQGRVRRMVSHNGTAGHNARRVQAFEYPCEPGVLVLHSDGLDNRWQLDRYPGLTRAHPRLVAGVLYRDHARGTDDATVLVLRVPPTLPLP